MKSPSSRKKFGNPIPHSVTSRDPQTKLNALPTNEVLDGVRRLYSSQEQLGRAGERL
jgi:hypothetical protein